MAQVSLVRSHSLCHRPLLTLQPAGSGVCVLVPDQPPLRAAPAEVPQHPQQLDEHQRDEVGEQVALADAHGMHSPGEGEQQPCQEEVDAVLAAEDLGVFLRVAAARRGAAGGLLHLAAAARCCSRRPRCPGEPRAAGPSPMAGRSGAAGPGRALPAGGGPRLRETLPSFLRDILALTTAGARSEREKSLG